MDAGIALNGRRCLTGQRLPSFKSLVFLLADLIRCLAVSTAITAFASTPGSSGVPGFQDEDSKGPALRAVRGQPAPGTDCFDVADGH